MSAARPTFATLAPEDSMSSPTARPTLALVLSPATLDAPRALDGIAREAAAPGSGTTASSAP